MSLPLMLALGAVLGIAAAFVVHLVWQITGFYLIFIFPAGMGFAAGFGLRIGIKVGKSRNVAVGMVVGLMIGLLSYMSMHYFDSVSYGAPDVMSYLQAMSEEGYSFFFIPISGIFAWIVWIIELAVVIYFSVFMAAGSSAEPYCEDCNRWCGDSTLFTSSNASSEAIVTALHRKQFRGLKEMITDRFNERNKLVGELSYCEDCKRKGYLTLTSFTPKGDDDETEEDTLVYAAAVGAESDNLLRDFRPTGQ